MILLHKNDLSAPTIRLIYRSKSSLRASSPGRSGGGKGKGRRACNYVSGMRCENAKFLLAEMTLVMTSLPWHVISNVCLNSRSFPLRADWRKSDSSVDGEPQGNWRWNSNSRDVVASGSYLFPPRRQSAPKSLLAG